ncbi:MAG TPA: TadE/TadG family type IV pilus assembly protein [Abditibacteriaceae bacterium]|nr:TadE/TadG family type IV pilus assembly protein [Abditibacteriaceae bacterium]
MRPLKHRHLSGSRRSGQAMIEMAASIFLLLAILMGVMEFGWLITRTYAVGNATREGARYAALGHTTTEVETRVTRNSGANFIAASNITMQYYDTATSTWKTMTNSGTKNAVASGSQIRVTVTISHKPLTRFFPFLNNRNITQYTVMRREL